MYNLSMTLSEELIWRGFLDQTTYKDVKEIDQAGINFYWGVDPSADSMTVGNLAIAILAKHLLRAGHKAYLLVGGATGLIGDPDGKPNERQLIEQTTIENNTKSIINQYQTLFANDQFEVINNLDWLKDLNYLDFLRQIGKHVPMRQMLNREFVDNRLRGNGISYAEFSYVLFQAYDFLTLFREKSISLQIAGSDQWGNCLAGVELIRRLEAKTANVWAAPLVTNRSTGKKFGKTEEGAIWLDANKTTPTSFYQFWINTDDNDLESFLKLYTFLSPDEINNLLTEHRNNPKARIGQKTLASQVTSLVHGDDQAQLAEKVTSYLTDSSDLTDASDQELSQLRKEISTVKATPDLNLINILVSSNLSKSNTEARQLITNGAIYIKGKPYKQMTLSSQDFINGRLLVRRGKAFKDTALIEL